MRSSWCAESPTIGARDQDYSKLTEREGVRIRREARSEEKQEERGGGGQRRRDGRPGGGDHRTV